MRRIGIMAAAFMAMALAVASCYLPPPCDTGGQCATQDGGTDWPGTFGPDPVDPDKLGDWGSICTSNCIACYQGCRLHGDNDLANCAQASLDASCCTCRRCSVASGGNGRLNCDLDSCKGCYGP